MEKLMLAIPGVILFFMFLYFTFNFAVLFNLRKRYFFALFIATDVWMCLSYKDWWPKIAVLFLIGAVAFYYLFRRLEAEAAWKAEQAKIESNDELNNDEFNKARTELNLLKDDPESRLAIKPTFGAHENQRL